MLDAQITLSQAQNDLAEVALEQTQALATLARTLGVNVTTVSGEPPTVTLPDLGDTDALLEQRSDILSARLAVQTAQLSADAAVRQVLPSGGVSASYSASDVTLAAGLSTETYQPSLSVGYDPDGSVAGTAGATREGLSAQVSLSIPLETGSGAALAAADTSVQNAQQQLGADSSASAARAASRAKSARYGKQQSRGGSSVGRAAPTVARDDQHPFGPRPRRALRSSERRGELAGRAGSVCPVAR